MHNQKASPPPPFSLQLVPEATEQPLTPKGSPDHPMATRNWSCSPFCRRIVKHLTWIDQFGSDNHLRPPAPYLIHLTYTCTESLARCRNYNIQVPRKRKTLFRSASQTRIINFVPFARISLSSTPASRPSAINTLCPLSMSSSSTARSAEQQINACSRYGDAEKLLLWLQKARKAPEPAAATVARHLVFRSRTPQPPQAAAYHVRAALRISCALVTNHPPDRERPDARVEKPTCQRLPTSGTLSSIMLSDDSSSKYLVRWML